MPAIDLTSTAPAGAASVPEPASCACVYVVTVAVRFDEPIASPIAAVMTDADAWTSFAETKLVPLKLW